MIRWWLRLVVLSGLVATACVAHAHESRPAYLEINEIQPGRYAVIWRTPVTAGMRLPVWLELPAGSRDMTPPSLRELSDSRIEHRLVEASGGLVGKRIQFVGLQGTITDVLVHVQLADGTQSNTLVHPSQAWVEITAAPTLFSVVRTYVRYGIEHILGGVDHLLFVLALLLIVRGGKRIFATITAFTVAHSMTLAAATLGWVHVPSPPVEAIIALSIVLVAVEIVRGMQGQVGLTARAPWLVAFCFGLLHGFGFAGALAAVGLPERAIPLALLCFNVGVEIGQLIFVALVFASIAVLQRLPVVRPRWIPSVAPYAIGSIASFWMLQRIVTFWQ